MTKTFCDVCGGECKIYYEYQSHYSPIEFNKYLQMQAYQSQGVTGTQAPKMFCKSCLIKHLSETK